MVSEIYMYDANVCVCIHTHTNIYTHMHKYFLSLSTDRTGSSNTPIAMSIHSTQLPSK